MAEVDENPPLRNELIDQIYDMLHNVISHYIHNHKDLSNEELEVVFNRLLSFHLQQKTHLYALYVWDLKKEEERLEKLKAKKLDFIK